VRTRSPSRSLLTPGFPAHRRPSAVSRPADARTTLSSDVPSALQVWPPQCLGAATVRWNPPPLEKAPIRPLPVELAFKAANAVSRRVDTLRTLTGGSHTHWLSTFLTHVR